MDRPPRVYLWQLFLCQQDAPSLSLDVALDLPNQRVVHSDVERTRNPFMTPEEKQLAEHLLTLYCKTEAISYKQGMNEVLAPFLFLGRQSLSPLQIYHMYSSFMRNYLRSTYEDEEFRPLQAQFLIFRLLVRYHDPRFSAFLNDLGVGPELFATPWFLTHFASKISDLEIVFELWDTYLEAHDELHSCYLGLAFIEYFRDSLISKHSSEIPQALSQLTIASMEELTAVLALSRRLKQSTPASIEIYLSDFNIFDLSTVDEAISQLEKLFCLSISPREVIQRCYPTLTYCTCSGQTCVWCRKAGRELTLAIVDCRPEEEQQQGTLQGLSLLDNKAYSDGIIMSELLDQFLDLKDNVHIALMGTRGFKVSNYELDTEDDVDSCQTMMVKLLQDFYIKGFPYVSVVEGGYEACHGLALSLNCELEGHVSGLCCICHPELSVKKKFVRLGNKVLGDLKSALKSASISLGTWAKSSPDPGLVPVPEPVARPKVFSFACHRRTREGQTTTTEPVLLTITSTELIACSLPSAPREWRVSTQLRWLSKITSKRKCPSALSFYFKQPVGDLVLTFSFADASEAKLCVRQITAKFTNLRREDQASLDTRASNPDL